MLSPKRNCGHGFTLIELLVVIAIIGILATVVVINLTNSIEKAKVSKAVELISTISKAGEVYKLNNDSYPAEFTDPNDPNGFLVAPDGSSTWQGPYLSQWNQHPWGGFVRWYPIHARTGTPLIFLDDDKEGTIHSSDNSAMIPELSLIMLDQRLDDGNLSSGCVRGNNPAVWNSAVGEVFINLYLPIENCNLVPNTP